MGCCISNINGLSGGGSAGGLSAPGVSFWTFASNGGPSDGIITTTDAVPVFRTWGTLPNVGSAINFFAMFYGQQTTGDRALCRWTDAGYARNGVGENALAPVAAVVTSGYDESASGMAPWNNLLANPPGWGGGATFLPGGNIIQVAFNGAAGQTIQWKCFIIAIPFNGATILV